MSSLPTSIKAKQIRPLREALEAMDQAGVWAALNNHYYQQWLHSPPGEWGDIKLKLSMTDDLRLIIRKMANSEVDNG